MTIAYPKPILIQRGQTIEIMMAVCTDYDYALAECIAVMETGVSYQLTPNERDAIRTPEVQERIQRFANVSPWRFPMLAQVVDCRQYGDYTHLYVHPLSQNPVDYQDAWMSVARAAVPAFWEQVDRREAWQEACLPEGMELWRLRSERPQNMTKHGIEVRRAVHRLFASKRCVDLPRFATATGDCEVKIAQAHRHLNRLNAIYGLRAVLYDVSESGGREFMLSETREEVVVTMEALAVTVFSALDILARAIDHLYLLTVSPIQRVSRVGFLRLIEGRNREGDDETTSPCLQNEFPDDPLTTFLLAERNGWIRSLEVLRHNIVHQTSLQAGEVARGGVLVGLPPRADPESLFAWDFHDARELATEWVENLRRVVHTSFDLMRQRAEASKASADFPADPYPLRLMEEAYHPHLSSLYEALEAWQAVPSEGDVAVGRFYERLAPEWQQRWSYHRCRALLTNRVLQDFSLEKTGSVTDKQYGQMAKVCVRMMFDTGPELWWFSLIQDKPARWSLTLTPLATFSASQQRVEVSGLWRKQSGRESGHRDILFGGLIHNISGEELLRVTVSVLCGDSLRDYWMLLTVGNWETDLRSRA